jgi:hypothetical protein
LGLLVEVTLSSLARWCGGQRNDFRVPTQSIDDGFDMAWVDVLGHLEAPDLIESPSQVERTSQVVSPDEFRMISCTNGGPRG